MDKQQSIMTVGRCYVKKFFCDFIERIPLMITTIIDFIIYYIFLCIIDKSEFLLFCVISSNITDRCEKHRF